ncbi:MAG: hypothetical protein ACE5OZ_22505 [Candidatus Heimdallarchaeota archaeon]
MKIIRLGGSLLADHELFMNLSSFFQKWHGDGLLLVPGGGIYAKKVRTHQKTNRLTDSQAHWMAIKSTEIMGVLLCELIPKAIPTNIPRSLPENEIEVIFPYIYFRDRNNLPHSWEATSDAIAALIGQDLGINDLFKLTFGPKDPRIALDSFSIKFHQEFGIKWTIITLQEPDFLVRLEKALRS